ncbi:hypothetical protein AB685_09685 [Bacillus sp. LL01]|uniref:hypothetical protein n=1 Tax=Bacillus sp. LL01 TaxID=1665556 RepID=UPI00064D21C8|nr:hypothetical protein [Bacillus sp. LL01]KMJ58178.1 hypothetical protein AB685_09685 [Bacillus sp. LL01]
MSFYYEQKGCCGKKEEHKKEEHKKEEKHELDCFCGKGIRQFLGQQVTVFVEGDALGPGLLTCFDEKTGLVTLVLDATTVYYICCRKIDYIQPVIAGA